MAGDLLNKFISVLQWRIKIVESKKFAVPDDYPVTLLIIPEFIIKPFIGTDPTKTIIPWILTILP